MDKLGIKATLYDFFGYLVPGLVFLLYAYVFYQNICKELNFIVALQSLAKYNKAVYSILVVLIGYCLGHIISSVSSFVIEKSIFGNIEFLKSKLELKEVVSLDLYNSFQGEYKRYFNVDYNSKDIRTLICYVEKNNPEIYSTAFVFLAIYGMARNLSMISFMFSIAEIGCFIYLNSKLIWIYILCGLGFGSVFFYEYFRFRKYFLQQIFNGMLI